jgi:GTP-binding protein HflX
VPVVAIVGYTNAGKSTLLNTLTDSDELAEDKLFATLDTRSRRLRFPEEREVVLTDTVGFIRDLPKDLFAAFRATFEEAADADLLLQVIDASDPARDEHVRTTDKLLHELELDRIPRIVVFNKADLLTPGEGERMLAGRDDAALASATHRETTRTLLGRIAEALADRWKHAELAPPQEDAMPALEDEHVASADDQITTLEGMLGDGKRKKRRLDVTPKFLSQCWKRGISSTSDRPKNLNRQDANGRQEVALSPGVLGVLAVDSDLSTELGNGPELRS